MITKEQTKKIFEGIEQEMKEHKDASAEYINDACRVLAAKIRVCKAKNISWEEMRKQEK